MKKYKQVIIGNDAYGVKDGALFQSILHRLDHLDGGGCTDPLCDYGLRKLQRDTTSDKRMINFIKLAMSTLYPTELNEGICPDCKGEIRNAVCHCKVRGTEVKDITLPPTEVKKEWEKVEKLLTVLYYEAIKDVCNNQEEIPVRKELFEPIKSFIYPFLSHQSQETEKRIIENIKGLKHRIDNAIMDKEREAENRAFNKVLKLLDTNK